MSLGGGVPSSAAAGEQKEVQRQELRATENGLSSIFPLASVLSARGLSRLCASLRPLRGAKNTVLTDLPLRSCVASSYRKNVRNKWVPRK